MGALLGSIHGGAGSPVRDALDAALRREMPLALDVLKYRGSSIPPAAIATSLPMPFGSPLPARLSIRTRELGGDAIRVLIEASALGARRSLNATLGARAPLPGAVVHAAALVPAPTGAP
jgi:hypothetical protein